MWLLAIIATGVLALAHVAPMRFLLDAMAAEQVRATFFLIDAHVTDETSPIIRRIFADGHAVGLHSDTRAYLLMSPDQLGRTLRRAADRIEGYGGTRPCRVFRPHAGWRGSECSRGSAASTTG